MAGGKAETCIDGAWLTFGWLLMLRRGKVLGLGLVLGAVFALLVAGPMMPSGMRVADRATVWGLVMGGPVFGTARGVVHLFPSIGLGWLGLLFIPAHAFRPNIATACVTLLGLSLWFFAGFLAVITAVWGA